MYEQCGLRPCALRIANNKSFNIDGDWEYQMGPLFAELPLHCQDRGSCPLILIGAHL